MEATNNGQTFRYNLPSETTKTGGGYTWASFKKANPHLEVAGLGDTDPSNDWIKATATAAGLITCKGKAQFNALGAQKIAEQCLPIVQQAQKTEHGTSEFANLTWAKNEFREVRKWFDGRCDSHDQEINKLILDVVSKIDRDATLQAFDKLIEEIDTLRATVDTLTARLAEKETSQPTFPPQPAPRRRRTWRDIFGF